MSIENKNENELGDKKRLHELIKSSLELFGLDQQLGNKIYIYVKYISNEEI